MLLLLIEMHPPNGVGFGATCPARILQRLSLQRNRLRLAGEAEAGGVRRKVLPAEFGIAANPGETGYLYLRLNSGALIVFPKFLGE
jgi:hypothetical protein